MTALFRKKASDQLASSRRQLSVTQDEAVQIRRSAHVRTLTMSEFIRRAALGRKAEVDYVTDTVLQLSDVVRAIRQAHKSMVERNITPPEEVWSPIMDGAMHAILRVGK
jgi:hypothetical protein